MFWWFLIDGNDFGWLILFGSIKLELGIFLGFLKLDKKLSFCVLMVVLLVKVGFYKGIIVFVKIFIKKNLDINWLLKK